MRYDLSSEPLHFKIARLRMEGRISDAADAQFRTLKELRDHIQVSCDEYVAALDLLNSTNAVFAESYEDEQRIRETYTTVDKMRQRFELLRNVRRKEETAQKWQVMAYRDSVMTVSHFRDLLVALNRELRLADELPVDKVAAPKKWFKALIDTFPDLMDIRNSVAHRAERASKESCVKRDTIEGSIEVGSSIGGTGSGKILLSGAITDDGFTYTRDGKVLSSRLDETGVRGLLECLYMVDNYLQQLVEAVGGAAKTKINTRRNVGQTHEKT